MTGAEKIGEQQLLVLLYTSQMTTFMVFFRQTFCEETHCDCHLSPSYQWLIFVDYHDLAFLASYIVHAYTASPLCRRLSEPPKTKYFRAMLRQNNARHGLSK